MKPYPIYSLFIAYLVASIATASPVKLIFDTDMGNDVDDAMALAMIHSLERRGACELIAVTSTKDHPKSVAFIDALNTWYSKPNIPIGKVRDGVTPELGRYLGLVDERNADGSLLYPYEFRIGEDSLDAVDLLRKELANQPDSSVTIAQVGFFTNLARLLESKPDKHSSLSGTELVSKKVKEVVVMAGAFQPIRHNTRYKEYNVRVDIASAQTLARNWPTPIVWSGFEVGIAASYPWESIMRDFDYRTPHIIKQSYLAYVPEQPHDRPTWDLTAVLYAVFPNRGYFDLSPQGSVTISDDGVTDFSTSPEGRDRYLRIDDLQAERVKEVFVQLVSQPPK